MPYKLDPFDTPNDFYQAPEKDAAEQALDEIAEICGCPHWEYPGQVVRDVISLVNKNFSLPTNIKQKKYGDITYYDKNSKELLRITNNLVEIADPVDKNELLSILIFDILNK